MSEEKEALVPEESIEAPKESTEALEAPVPEEIPADQAKTQEPVHVVIKQRLAATPIVFRLILLGVLIAALVGLFFFIKSRFEKDKNDGKITLDAIEIQIKEVLHTARLNTAEYMYKGVVNWFVPEENGKQTKVGYVKYSGKIKYGVDFDEIEVRSDDARNRITITIPPLRREPYVEEAECIFLNQSMRSQYNDSKYMNQMRTACMDHISYNAEKDTAMQDTAEKYTKELVESLTRPFFEADSEFSLEIRMGD